MNITGVVGGGIPTKVAGERSTAAESAVGQVGTVQSIHVLERAGGDRYRVQLRDRELLARSAQRLVPGETLNVRILSEESPIRLQVVQEQADQGSGGTERSAEIAIVDDLAVRFNVSLSPEQRSSLLKAIGSAESPLAMTLAGLFLGKLGQPLTDTALQALHDAQVNVSQGSFMPIDAGQIQFGPAPVADRARVARLLGERLEHWIAEPVPIWGKPESPATDGTAASDGNTSDDGSGRSGRDAEHHSQAVRLLNLEDGGNSISRFASLPLIVDGHLVELDVAMFHERDPSQTAVMSRRVVISVRTDSLGVIEGAIHAVADRLSIDMAAQSPAAALRLSAHQAELRDLLQEMGWRVDRLRVRDHAVTNGATSAVIQRVLDQGTINERF